MKQPEELKKDQPLLWSTGRGIDVWGVFCACIQGDLEEVKRLLAKDPALARCQYSYRTPIYFAVRENRLEVAAYLLDHGADPLSLAANDRTRTHRRAPEKSWRQVITDVKRDEQPFATFPQLAVVLAG